MASADGSRLLVHKSRSNRTSDHFHRRGLVLEAVNAMSDTRLVMFSEAPGRSYGSGANLRTQRCLSLRDGSRYSPCCSCPGVMERLVRRHTSVQWSMAGTHASQSLPMAVDALHTKRPCFQRFRVSPRTTNEGLTALSRPQRGHLGAPQRRRCICHRWRARVVAPRHHRDIA